MGRVRLGDFSLDCVHSAICLAEDDAGNSRRLTYKLTGLLRRAGIWARLL